MSNQGQLDQGTRKVIAGIMLELKSMGLSTHNIENVIGYQNQLGLGLIENNLTDMRLIELGYKKMRAWPKGFFPAVGEFIDACKPNPEDFGYEPADIAYKTAVAGCHSSKRHELEPLHYTTSKMDWELLQSPRMKSAWMDRYIETFRNHILRGIPLESPTQPKMLTTVKSEPTKESKEFGQKTMNEIMRGVK